MTNDDDYLDPVPSGQQFEIPFWKKCLFNRLNHWRCISAPNRHQCPIRLYNIVNWNIGNGIVAQHLIAAKDLLKLSTHKITTIKITHYLCWISLSVVHIYSTRVDPWQPNHMHSLGQYFAFFEHPCWKRCNLLVLDGVCHWTHASPVLLNYFHRWNYSHTSIRLIAIRSKNSSADHLWAEFHHISLNGIHLLLFVYGILLWISMFLLWFFQSIGKVKSKRNKLLIL